MAVSGLFFGLIIIGLIALVGGLVAVFLLNRNQREAAPYTGSLDDDVRSLAQSGRQIEAIKLVRRQTGLGLAEARAYVQQAAQGAAPSLTAGPASLVADPDLDRQVHALLLQKQKIVAIKLVRQQTGLGLKEAKDYVDHLERSTPFS